MATGSYMTPTYSRSQSDVQRNLHKWGTKNDLSKPHTPFLSTFQRLLENSTCVINCDVIDFYSSFHKYPYDLHVTNRITTKFGRQKGCQLSSFAKFPLKCAL
ncbi:hypothetical protein TNCV_4499241 [Trichonephila clavipes]|nr:hypothetical protein TNCV_4499241 [Trichonephila clavipes]